MYRNGITIEDLQSELLLLKKEFSKVERENYLLKVKIRKLQDDIGKKNRHIQILLDPKKCLNYRKITSEHGAMMVLNLQDQNLELQKTIAEKNMIIKRLQNDLQATRLYSINNSDKKKCIIQPTDYEIEAHLREINLTIPYFHSDTDCEKVENRQTRSNSFIELFSKDKKKNKDNCSEPILLKNEDVQSEPISNSKELEYEKLYENLEKIKSVFCKEEEATVSKSPTLQTIFDRKLNKIDKAADVYIETPQKEIEQLQKYVVDVISEVTELRSAISSLRHEKERLRAASLTPPKFKKTEAASAGQIPRTKTQNLIKPNKSETDRDRLIVFERKGRRENNRKTKSFSPKSSTEFPKKITEAVQKKCDILKAQLLDSKMDSEKPDIVDSSDSCDLESEYIYP